jgi:hypothetical protein
MLFRTERTEIHITGAAVFWLFAIIYIMIEAVQFNQGYDTFFWRHKTVEEKEIQKIKIAEMRDGCINLDSEDEE